MKTKIHLEQTSPDADMYRVLSLVNRVNPRVGTLVADTDIEKLLADDEEVTITIKKAR